MLRTMTLAGALLLPLGCAHVESDPTPTVPREGAELSALRRDNQALRRRLQVLEDRVLRLEHGTSSAGATPMVAPRVAKTLRPAPEASPSPAPRGAASVSLGVSPLPPEALAWDEGSEGLEPVDFMDDPPDDAEPPADAGAAGGYRLVGSRLVKLTQDHGPVAPDPPAQGRAARSVEARYESAMGLYRKGEFSAAEQEFAALAREAPQSDLADNALYWKGEAAYDQAHFADALTSFTEVVERYGGGNKAPDALLKIGLCYDKLGDPANAHDVLRRLVAAYPGARASDIARARLAELEVQT